jgi:hypothetical protein
LQLNELNKNAPGGNANEKLLEQGNEIIEELEQQKILVKRLQ